MLNTKLCSLKSMANLYLLYNYKGQTFVNMKKLCATLFMQLLMKSILHLIYFDTQGQEHITEKSRF